MQRIIAQLAKNSLKGKMNLTSTAVFQSRKRIKREARTQKKKAPQKPESEMEHSSKRSSSNSRPLTGVVFEPFEEVKKELDLVPTVPQVSIARQKYSDDCEADINEQINVEYNVSYVYHAMYAYFDRDNVALKGLAKFFKESSEEEKEYAEKLMEYQNKRGGKVKLQSIVMPLSEFDHAEKGDTLYAMELALSLEELTNEKLLNLHSVADRNKDVQLADFVESEYLTEQVQARRLLNMLRNLGESARDMESGILIRCCSTRGKELPLNKPVYFPFCYHSLELPT